MSVSRPCRSVLSSIKVLATRQVSNPPGLKIIKALWKRQSSTDLQTKVWNGLGKTVDKEYCILSRQEYNIKLEMVRAITFLAVVHSSRTIVISPGGNLILLATFVWTLGIVSYARCQVPPWKQTTAQFTKQLKMQAVHSCVQKLK